MYTIQNSFRKIVGFTPCIPLGRGMFQYSFGIVPHRHPVHTVGKEKFISELQRYIYLMTTTIIILQLKFYKLYNC